MSEAPPAITLAQRLAALRRRRGPMLLAFLGVLALSVALAFLWPPTYVATGTILIEQQEVPTDLVRSTISSYADQRIQVISQRVMTTDNLLRIIDRFGLYAQQRKRQGREAIISLIREDIAFKMISADVIDPRQGRPTQATIAFSVSFSHRSPDIAARVANEVVSLYLQENLSSRKQLTDNTATFLTAEADKLSVQISELEGKLAEFKEQHVNNLPDLARMNLELLSRTDLEKRDVDAQIRLLDQQVVYLDAQLAQLSPTSQVYTSTGERVQSPADRLKFLRTEFARASALYAPDHPDVDRIRREIAGLEKSVGEVDSARDLARQLQDAQTQLTAARQRYGSDHPDVQTLERLVSGIATQASTEPSVAAATAEAANPDNPAFIQVKAQREAAVNERASLQSKRREVAARASDLERRLDSSPGVEREYTALTRELENSQLRYREVRQKQLEATLSQSLEVERKGERFTLIEPPLPPEEPASPNRTMLLVLGVVLASAAGIGMAMLLELLDGSIRGRADLTRVLTVPPLAVIPWLETRFDRRARRLRRGLAMAGTAAAMLTAVTLVHLYYRPLDVLWAVALRRMGG